MGAILTFSRAGEKGGVRASQGRRLSHPHPALRATFSREAGEGSVRPYAASCRST